MFTKITFLNKRILLIPIAMALLAGCARTSREAFVSTRPLGDGPIVLRTGAASDADPFQAGKAAAEALRRAMGGTAPKAVLLAECFGDKSLKRRALKGVASVFPRDILFGGASYGSFSQAGCLGSDSVGLLGIGGAGIAVSAALVENMGVSGLTLEEHGDAVAGGLRKAGGELARKLPKSSSDRLVVVVADAHSPRNQFLIEGMHPVLGNDFPITGGSVNKNAGETFVYYRGGMYQDAALALALSGDFRVSLSGRQARTNDAVIASAGEGAAEALAGLKARPFAMFAFNCAGRKGKLDNLEDELEAIRKVAGRDLPIFGSYCAGEFGPVDEEDKKKSPLSGGSGWHVMCTFLGRD